jgi:hypothetical protein
MLHAAGLYRQVWTHFRRRFEAVNFVKLKRLAHAVETILPDTFLEILDRSNRSVWQIRTREPLKHLHGPLQFRIRVVKMRRNTDVSLTLSISPQRCDDVLVEESLMNLRQIDPGLMEGNHRATILRGRGTMQHRPTPLLQGWNKPGTFTQQISTDVFDPNLR